MEGEFWYQIPSATSTPKWIIMLALGEKIGPSRSLRWQVFAPLSTTLLLKQANPFIFNTSHL